MESVDIQKNKNIANNMYHFICRIENILDMALSENLINAKLALKGLEASSRLFKGFNDKNKKSLDKNTNFEILRLIFEDMRKKGFDSPELDLLRNSLISCE